MKKAPAFLGKGINLGNSLDCFDDNTNGLALETAWENPVTTREIVKMYADAGFDTLRIPVTWGVHMDKDNKVDPAWMARVHTVVDWALEEGMAVILNTHHEFDWIKAKLSLVSDYLERYRALWEQIALSFRDYPEKLVLQGLNEPSLHGDETCEYDSGTRSIRAAINVLNHTFVRTVRETGGNNADRWLCIPNIMARPLPEAMQEMIAPDDDRVIYAIHCYAPNRFVFRHSREENTAIFDEKAKAEMHAMFEDIKRYAIPHGMPIVITEWGAEAKRMPGTEVWNTEERLKFVNEFRKCTDELSVPCVWWDNNYLDRRDEYFGLFERETLTCLFPEIVQACVRDMQA